MQTFTAQITSLPIHMERAKFTRKNEQLREILSITLRRYKPAKQVLLRPKHRVKRLLNKLCNI